MLVVGDNGIVEQHFGDVGPELKIVEFDVSA